MHGTAEAAHALVNAVAVCASRVSKNIEVVVCPPATLIREVVSAAGLDVRVGGQDCRAEPEGAYTGDISAAMLKDAGCTYVIVGHSERRHHHRETDNDISKKAAGAMKADLVPIICVGETQAERSAGKALEVVGAQVKHSLPQEAAKSDFLLAYEPVWAIGSGQTPTSGDIAQMHAHIVAAVSRETKLDPQRVSVLYGGSVKAANAREILTTKHVSGVLVGGASLKAEEFCEIIESVRS